MKGRRFLGGLVCNDIAWYLSFMLPLYIYLLYIYLLYITIYLAQDLEIFMLDYYGGIFS